MTAELEQAAADFAAFVASPARAPSWVDVASLDELVRWYDAACKDDTAERSRIELTARRRLRAKALSAADGNPLKSGSN